MAKSIFVEIVGNASQFKKELEGAVASTNKANSGWSKMSKAAGVAGLALGGVLAVGIDKAAKSAEAAQVSTARMDAAFKSVHLSAAAFAGQIDNAEASSRKLGFENSAVRDSLGSLAIATHNGTSALKDLGVAEDIARFKHSSLEAATKTLSMAMAGSQRAIKQLGLQVAPTTANMDELKAKYKELGTAIPPANAAQAKFLDKQQTAKDVIALVSEKLHGQAQAFSDTAAGAQARYGAQIDNLKEKLGAGLLPIIAKVADGLSVLADFFSKHTALAKTLAIGLGVLSVAMLASSAAAFVLANAMTLGIAAAVTVLIAGVVLLVRHWGTVKEKMMEVAGWIEGTFLGAWDDVKGALIGVKNWIAAHWPEIVTLISGPFAPLVALATNAFGVRSAMEDALRALKNFASARVDEIAGFFTALPGKIGAAISAGAGAIKKSITELFGKVIGWVKDVLGISSPSSVFHEIGQHVIQGFINGVGSMAGTLKNAVVGLAESLPGRVAGAVGNAGQPAAGGDFSAAGGTVAQGKLMAKSMYGWTGPEFTALYNLWQGESGWSDTAYNHSSGAQGIPQFLPMPGRPTPKGFPGNPPLNSAAQIAWGLNYIKGSYGDPINAYGKWLSRSPHWYAKGGIFNAPTIIGVGEAGPEAVVPLNRLGGGDTYVVNIPNYVGDKRELVDLVTRELYRLQKRNGTTGIK